ncbi:MAG: HAD family phosphatase [Rhodoferax sp.]|nr:HAD family phosphatase [Rhodoferax sp.]
MIAALIFDMDGTMVDSMPWHAQSWVAFTRRYGMEVDLPDLMRRTNGRNGLECMREIFQRDMPDEEARALIHEKEVIYRSLFAPVFTEVQGFRSFAAHARTRGLKVGIGTAGDQDNIAFVLQGLAMPEPPHVIVGGDEGLPGKPDPAIFLEAARRMGVPPKACIVFEDSPFGIEAAGRAGMPAVAICSSHSAQQLAGAHVLAHVPNYTELLHSKFLENLHVAPA